MFSSVHVFEQLCTFMDVQWQCSHNTADIRQTVATRCELGQWVVIWSLSLTHTEDDSWTDNIREVFIWKQSTRSPGKNSPPERYIYLANAQSPIPHSHIGNGWTNVVVPFWPNQSVCFPLSMFWPTRGTKDQEGRALLMSTRTNQTFAYKTLYFLMGLHLADECEETLVESSYSLPWLIMIY